MKFYRYRPANSEHFEDDLENAIWGSKFFGFPCSKQSDIGDSLPVYVESATGDVSNYLSLVQRNFGPYMHYTGFNSLHWRRELREFPFRTAFREWLIKLQPLLEGATVFRSIPVRDDVNREVDFKFTLGKPSSTDELVYGFMTLETGDTRVAAYNAIKRCMSTFIDQRESTLISCFTTRESDQMWREYADDSKGVCIEYSYSECLHDDAHPRFERVLYEDPISNVHTIEIMKFLGVKLQILNPRFLVGYRRLQTEAKISRMKKATFSWECEWRLIQFDEVGPRYIDAPFLRPVRLILGKELSEDISQHLREKYGKHIDIA